MDCQEAAAVSCLGGAAGRCPVLRGQDDAVAKLECAFLGKWDGMHGRVGAGGEERGGGGSEGDKRWAVFSRVSVCHLRNKKENNAAAWSRMLLWPRCLGQEG